MSQKNIIVIHLESLSSELWDMYAEDLQAIKAIKDQSRSYTNFISSATSTHMCQTAFLTGRDDALDHINIFGSGQAANVSREDSLWGILEQQGYRTGGLIFPIVDPGEHETFVKLGISPFSQERYDFEDLDEFVEEVGEFCSGETPWALYIHPLVAHICYTNETNPEELDFHEYTRRGYADMDKLVQQLRDLLENQKDDTVWLFYGDHGDSIHTHGWNYGLAHTGDPHFPLIHCPLFLTGPGIEPEVKDDLLATTDCREMVFQELGISTESPKSHKAVFSQNLFADQQPNHLLNKSFAAYDGTYILMVSALGLEMYDCRLDHGNHNNLLSFFKLQKDGSIEHSLADLPYNKHPPKIHSPKTNEDIQTHFYALRKELSDHLDRKYDRLGESVKYRLPPKAFRKIRTRKFYWLYPTPWRRNLKPAMIRANMRRALRFVLKTILPTSLYGSVRKKVSKSN
ncbi:MAG: sulfatase-like hydrolase/transferase [Phycisphaerales bacterium]|nr:sulfatase-like hydrolase/transferase [Phycisphaerales bacterium]